MHCFLYLVNELPTKAKLSQLACTLADKAQIWVRAKDVPEPRSKDEVYINGEKWYVDHISNFDGTMYCIEIVHNVRAVRP